MNITKTVRILFIALLSIACLQAAAADKPLKYSNKWRIECSGGAHSSGNIVFDVTPYEGTATVVTVAIEKGRSEDHVAKDIRDAMRSQLSTERFHAEVDDGEDVLVKAIHGQPKFNIKLNSTTVEHVRIKFNKE